MPGINISTILDGSKAMADGVIPFLLTGASTLTGLYLVWKAISLVYSMGKPQRSMQSSGEASVMGIAMRLLIGGFMLRLGSTMEDVSQLLFGSGIQDYRGVLAYAPMPAQAGVWRQIMEVILLWVVMLGWIGAFRGLLLWSKAGDGGGGGGRDGDPFWGGFWHVVGGGAAINLTGAIQAFIGR